MSTEVWLFLSFLIAALIAGMAYETGHVEGHRKGLCARINGVGPGPATSELCRSWGYP